MFPRHRVGWLLISVPFWIGTAYGVWHLGPVGAAFAVLGMPVGWAAAVYKFIPSHYRYMVETLEGRRQDEGLHWKTIIVGTVLYVILVPILGPLGLATKYAMLTVVLAAGGTIAIAIATSRKLVEMAHLKQLPGPAEYDDGEGRLNKHARHPKKRRRGRD